MNDNRGNKSKAKNKSGSYFIIAQMLASITIVFCIYFLKRCEPSVYSEFKDWYNYNIRYKNFDTSNFKEAAINLTNRISDSVFYCAESAISFLNKQVKPS